MVKQDGIESHNIIDVDISDLTRQRFLNYALSVISSRALPDVRDGLKPVQRRIIYAMFRDLKLVPEKKTLKCAKIVGQVLGNYHPHGDSAVYETLVRMAQYWSLRYPLIEGQGNFGSLDGDGAAAYRYTEARLDKMAMEFVRELQSETVDFRPNFDDSAQEPVVLPAKVPQLLVNGCSGIAVGVATNIPPHNLKEVLEACCLRITEPQSDIERVMQIVRGPDFPLGGEILESRETLRQIYETGSGRIRTRGTYSEEGSPVRGRKSLVIQTLPYMVQKGNLMDQLFQILDGKELPQLLDVRDESGENIRIVLEVPKATDPELIMGFLYKNTFLQSSFHVNMTCLIPSPHDSSVLVPARLGLIEVLDQFNRFRYEVVVRRLEHERRQLEARIHILEALCVIFDDLDNAIRLIRESEGRQDAAEKLKQRYRFDQAQVDAILELRLYRLAKLDILTIREELGLKQARLDEVLSILASSSSLWQIVTDELNETLELHKDARRTSVRVRGFEEIEVEATDLIPDEETVVILTKDGWLRRMGSMSSLDKVRLRQGDEVFFAEKTSTLKSLILFSTRGIAYTVRVYDIPESSRSFGEPIFTLFQLEDGEKIVNCWVVDATEEQGGGGMIMLSDGRGYRFPWTNYNEPSTRAGRKYVRLSEGVDVVAVLPAQEDDLVALVTREGNSLVCRASDFPELSGIGKGVVGIKVAPEDKLAAYSVAPPADLALRVVREEGGREIVLSMRSSKVTRRGGKGKSLIKRGNLCPVPQLWGNATGDVEDEVSV